MKRITRIIRPIICMAVLLFAMTTAVMGCYQKETEPIDIPGRTPSGTSAPQPSATPAGEVIPSVDRQAALAEARAKNPDGEDMIFQITALFITDIGFDYIASDPTGDDLTSFFETVARKNWLDFDGVTFSEDDTVLTLSTCCRKYDKTNSGNQRLVVMAKLPPEGAAAQEFSVSLVDDPEMP